jgi:hypothetical protein
MRVDRLERLYALAEEDRQGGVPEGPSDWSRRSLAVADPAGLVRHVLSAFLADSLVRGEGRLHLGSVAKALG